MNEFNPAQPPTMGPRPQLGFMEAVKICLQEKYCNFEGRARRSEYWWFYLFYVIVLTIASYIGTAFGGLQGARIAQSIVCLPLILPSLGAGARRLHDIGKSGWWLLIGLIPIVGAIILIVWGCQDSDPQENEYGPSPKYQ